MQLIHVKLPTLTDDTDQYVIPGLPSCRIVGAYTVLNTSITSGDSTITISDGSTDVGEIVITQSSCSPGDIDEIVFDGTSKGEVEFGPAIPILINNDNVPGAGKCMLTLILDEFHADN